MLRSALASRLLARGLGLAKGGAHTALALRLAPLAVEIGGAATPRAAAPALAACRGVSASAAAPALAARRGFSASAAPHTADGDDVDDLVLYPAATAFVGAQAPRFDAPALVDGALGRVALQAYLDAGKYVCLFFYPKDFTFVCPTEIVAFNDRAPEFEARGCALVAASTDTEESHLAWTRVPRSRGGLGSVAIPIVADVTKAIAARYGCLIEDRGVALRGLYIISPDGVLQHATVNALGVGRSVDEALRTLAAIQHVAEHGEVCPAGWTPGDEAMKAGPESAAYFAAVGDTDRADAFGGTLPTVDTRDALDAVLAAHDKVVVDVMAPWCGKCAMIAPLVEKLQAAHSGVHFVKVDTTRAPKEFVESLGAAALPTFKLYRGGKEDVAVVGYKKKVLQDAVEALAAKK